MHWLGINWAAVLCAGMACMAIGFLWYSPVLFAKPWMRGMGWDAMTPEQLAAERKKAGPMYGVSLLLSWVTAAVLARFFVAMDVHLLSPAMKIAFAAWLGFIMPVQATGAMFGGQKRVLFLVNTGYQLVCLLATGAILGLWG